MASLVTLGLSKIEIGAIAGDGGMGTTLTQLAKTLEGSCSFVQDDAEVTEHYCEEADAPLYQSFKAGKLTLKFTAMDLDADGLVSFLGGTSVGSPKTFSAPSAIFTQEKSVKLTTTTGLIFNIVRCLMIGKVNAVLGKKDIFKVEVTGTVLLPTKAATAPWSAVNPA